MGASRTRLLQQWMTESVLMSVLGGIAGLLVASWSKSALIHFLPQDLQANLNQPMNWGVFGVALGGGACHWRAHGAGTGCARFPRFAGRNDA